jgi:transcriptional regulator with XRE-family HTH domain
MDTTTDLYAFVMGELRAKRIPQRQVACESGVPFSTVTKIAQGQTKDPAYSTIRRLANYFEKVGAGNTAQREAA